MDLSLLSGYSLEVMLIALGVFALTQLIKIPIKKWTSKLEESKRKSANFVIILVALALSFFACFLYYGIKTKNFLCPKILSSSFSAFVLSLSIHAVCSRVWLIFKGLKDGSLSKEQIDYFKGQIKDLLKQTKIDEEDLKQIESELSRLEKLKELLLGDEILNDKAKVDEVSNNIDLLCLKRQELESRISAEREKTQKYQAKLTGENVKKEEKEVENEQK